MFLQVLRFLLGLTLLVDAQSIDKRDQDFWNSKFNDPNALFNRQPSRLLAAALRNRPPGRALDLGMGQGRNTIFLAQQGWDATGVDLSNVAVTQANARASDLKVKINAIIDSADHYDL